MTMKKPSHPGHVVRTLCLKPNGLTVTAAAEGLGVSRQALNNLVNRKAAMSADMAIRLEKGFGIKAEMWLNMQLAYDLANAYKNARGIHVKPLIAAA
ncbi:MAG: HigA family addiction module antidote protein [Gemmatimonadaceae bacterium]|nr:HigA family addiction module antidote protein [Gemmatimonadaceae bacterium]